MAKAEREDYQKSLVELIGCRPVAYWPALARRVGGVKAAVLLSQLMYWNGDKGVQKRNGWFWKSVQDLEEETGLTQLEQQTARETLTDLGVIETVLKGIPRIWHYRVNLDELTSILIEPVSHSMGKPFNGKAIQWESHSMGKPSNIDPESQSTLNGFPNQLNKESESTYIDYLTENTSSSSVIDSDLSTGEKEEEEVTRKFSKEMIDLLLEIGIFENLISEIEASPFTEEELAILMDDCENTETESGKLAGLFMYRLRDLVSKANNGKRIQILSPEERTKKKYQTI